MADYSRSKPMFVFKETAFTEACVMLLMHQKLQGFLKLFAYVFALAKTSNNPCRLLNYAENCRPAQTNLCQHASRSQPRGNILAEAYEVTIVGKKQAHHDDNLIAPLPKDQKLWSQSRGRFVCQAINTFKQVPNLSMIQISVCSTAFQ
eukprot:1156659-Pelagomonas_calceolata.AAC.6